MIPITNVACFLVHSSIRNILGYMQLTLMLVHLMTGRTALQAFGCQDVQIAAANTWRLLRLRSTAISQSYYHLQPQSNKPSRWPHD